MIHTNFFSSIRKTAYEPLIWTGMTNTIYFCSASSNFERIPQTIFVHTHIYKTNIYIYMISLNHMRAFQIQIYNTKNAPNTKMHSKTFIIIFQKSVSFGTPGPLQKALEPSNWFTHVKSYARCSYTNNTCPLAKGAQKYKNTCSIIFTEQILHNFVYVEGHTA